MTAVTSPSDGPPPAIAYDPAPPLDNLGERLAAGATLIDVDQPGFQNNGPVAAPLQLNGWTFSKRGVAEVWAVVDGQRWVQILHGQWRAYLINHLDDPQAGASGFTVVLSEQDCPPGTRTIAIVAIDNDGFATGLEGIVEVLDTRDPQGAPEPDSALPPTERLDGNGERFVPELHGGETIEAEHQARYRWAAPLADGRDVLDAGCGVGWGSAILAGGGARSVVGVDIHEPALESARLRAGGTADFVRGDLAALPFDDDSFDLVVSFEAIEHVTDPEAVLDEFRRVLRPGGLLAISSPNRGVYPAGNPHHLRELTSAELEGGLRQRFANLTLFRQQTHVGSILLEDDGFAVTDPSVPLAADVRKVVGGFPGEELYTVAVCSDGELPALQGVTVLSKEVDFKPYMETIAYLEQRALTAEHQLATANAEIGMLRFEQDKTLMRLQAADRGRRAVEERVLVVDVDRNDAARRLGEVEDQLGEVERRLQETAGWLEDHRRSLSWKVTKPLRAAKRRAAARAGIGR